MQAPTVAVLATEQNGSPLLDIPDNQQEILKEEANHIDAYFLDHNMPMAGYGMKMAVEAYKNDIDPYLIPAIAVRESTGGKEACKNATWNPFGWGGCKISFKSYDEAIEVLAKNLGGNNPKTAHHYDNKTTKEILQAYNPPYIVERYAPQVMKIMKYIESHETNQS